MGLHLSPLLDISKLRTLEARAPSRDGGGLGSTMDGLSWSNKSAAEKSSQARQTQRTKGRQSFAKIEANDYESCSSPVDLGPVHIMVKKCQ